MLNNLIFSARGYRVGAVGIDVISDIYGRFPVSPTSTMTFALDSNRGRFAFSPNSLDYGIPRASWTLRVGLVFEIAGLPRSIAFMVLYT